jgi:hypothetical protein
MNINEFECLSFEIRGVLESVIFGETFGVQSVPSDSEVESFFCSTILAHPLNSVTSESYAASCFTPILYN